jgi:hypothetical protein
VSEQILAGAKGKNVASTSERLRLSSSKNTKKSSSTRSLQLYRSLRSFRPEAQSFAPSADGHTSSRSLKSLKTSIRQRNNVSNLRTSNSTRYLTRSNRNPQGIPRSVKRGVWLIARWSSATPWSSCYYSNLKNPILYSSGLNPRSKIIIT